MPILTTISGIPLYTTANEALAWAAANNLTGYHTHVYQGVTGYMGGSDHSVATRGRTSTSTRRTTTGPNTSVTYTGSTGGY
jgi:hypothetical protein